MNLFYLIGILLFVNTNAFNIDKYLSQLLKINYNETLTKEFNNNIDNILSIDPNYYKPKTLNDFGFDCEPISNEPATSVHQLKPNDIKIVAALGDSLTAGAGALAKNVFNLVNEYRGVSWSIGGDKNVESYATMPNIIKMFSPDLIGFSTGKSLALTTKSGVGLNVAVSGQEANHIPEQAKNLVERLKSFNWQNDWKLITLFIGGNDLCDYCKDKNLHSPTSYIKYVEEGLDYLHQNLPKTFVNLVSVLNVTPLKLMNKNLICSGLHHFMCPCAAFPESEDAEKELATVISQYHDLTHSLVNSGKYDTRDDFTVVMQPFMEGFEVPTLPDGNVDYSYFAPDCFHFSAKSHGISGVNLWNNMLQPIGQKSNAAHLNPKVLCPTKEKPFFFTSKNS